VLHVVPSVFAKDKELASIYQRYWNAHVGTGEALLSQRGEEERLVEATGQSGTVPQQPLHGQELFL
jgi:hypothetical protein